MKRVLSKLLVLSLVIVIPLSICSCKKKDGSKKLTRRTGIKTESVTETDVPTSTPEPDVSPEPTETVPASSSDETLSKGSENTSSYDCEVQVLPPREVPAYEYQEIKIEDTEILNKDGLSIHVYGFDVGMGSERSIHMKVDNQTGHPVTLHLEKLVLDGFCEIPMWMMDFENGVATECELSFYLTLGSDIGLWNPGKIDISFRVEYKDTQETYVSELATVYTSVYDSSKTYDFPDAYTVYEEGGIKISLLGYIPAASRSDASLVFLIENNSEHEITVKTEESLINGIPLNVHLFKSLLPGEKSVATPTIYQSKLKEAKISSIKTISMILRIQFDNDYKNSFVIDPFAVSVE